MRNQYGLAPQLVLWDDAGMEKPTGQDFFARLIEALRDAGLSTTQTSIAEYLGINQSAVAKWKSGESFPEYEHAFRLAQRAEVSIPWLLLGIGNKSDMDEQTLELLRSWEKMPEQARAELLQFVRFRVAATGPDRDQQSDNNANKH
jgi:transcriptional regulator with XRE-family HTH domain